MPNQLQDEIKQAKPFVCAEQEAMLNKLRAKLALTFPGGHYARLYHFAKHR